jgi:predicted secreted hydrolase
MAHLGDWFSAHLSSKEDIDLQRLRDHRNNWAPGQTINNFSRGALIAVLITGVRITLSRIVLSPGSLFKGRVLIRTIRVRARSE